MMSATTVAHTRHGASHRLAGTVTFPDPPPPISVIIQDVQCTREALAATVVIHPQLPVLFFFFLSFFFVLLLETKRRHFLQLASRTHAFHTPVWDVPMWFRDADLGRLPERTARLQTRTLHMGWREVILCTIGGLPLFIRYLVRWQ